MISSARLCGSVHIFISPDSTVATSEEFAHEVEHLLAGGVDGLYEVELLGADARHPGLSLQKFRKGADGGEGSCVNHARPCRETGFWP